MVSIFDRKSQIHIENSTSGQTLNGTTHRNSIQCIITLRLIFSEAPLLDFSSFSISLLPNIL